MNAPPGAAAPVEAAGPDAEADPDPGVRTHPIPPREWLRPTGTIVIEGSPPAASARRASMAGPFEFVRRLTIELSSGDLTVPSFPDIADRVRRALDDERASQAHIAQVVASDGALAARVLRIANSTMFNPGGQPITELPTAIGRVGHELVRCAAVAFALAQMRAAVRAPELRPVLQESWRSSTLVAAIAHVLARETRVANPDAALVTGLLHNVGRLFIASHAHLRVADYASAADWDEVLNDWHPQVGRTILRQWQFPDAIADAIGAQDAAAPETETETDTTDGLHGVLVCALALVPCVWQREQLDAALAAQPAFARLGIDVERCRRLLAATATQIKQMRDALSG